MTEVPSGFSILVVEEDFYISDVCKKALSADGFTVALAADERTARKMLLAQDYDLILLEVRVPKAIGTGLYHWLNDERPEMARRVMFITGDVLIGDTLDFLKTSARPFLPKPFSLGELRARVKQEIERLGKKIKRAEYEFQKNHIGC